MLMHRFVLTSNLQERGGREARLNLALHCQTRTSPKETYQCREETFC